MLGLIYQIILSQNDDNNELPNDKNINNAPETEILRYNLFYDMKKYEFSGALRANESIIDWIKRLLIFCRDIIKTWSFIRIMIPTFNHQILYFFRCIIP